MEVSARARPPAAEFDPYYARYIERVDRDDVLEVLSEQGDEIVDLLSGLDPGIGDFRYQPGKWSLKQVICHLLDTERIFAVRALCIARGDLQPLPGFDENAYADLAGADRRTIGSLAREFEFVRNSSITLFESLDDKAW
ncbi:MAG: DinB family protein, partial [Gemmatimonadota bacterium]